MQRTVRFAEIPHADDADTSLSVRGEPQIIPANGLVSRWLGSMDESGELSRRQFLVLAASATGSLVITARSPSGETTTTVLSSTTTAGPATTLF
ncbi:MAG: twin-arginine translocation signal domain-containing protein [bacterium]|nr:twin-arginine translocation signal domain-containing protein [bacterium]